MKLLIASVVFMIQAGAQSFSGTSIRGTSIMTLPASGGGGPAFQPTVLSGQDIPTPSGGDTQSCLWTSAATKPGAFGGGSIVCTYNDGHDSTVPTGMCSGGGGGNSVCVYQMTAYDKTNVANTKFAAINYMGSYSSYSDNTACYDRIHQMKSRKMFAVGSLWLLPIFCMNGSAPTGPGHPYEGFQSGFVVSTDLGAHFCNYKTFQAGGNTCTASNWVANGDNPQDAAGFQWPIDDQTNRMSRISLVDFLCQDNNVSCPVAAGVDPNYLYAMSDSSDEQTTTLIRGLKSDGILLMLPSHWQAYNAGLWQSNLQTGSNIVVPGGGIGCCGTVVYIADYNSFGMWQHPTSFATAPTPWGPWTAGAAITPAQQGFPAPVAGLCPKYDVAGRVTCTVFAAPQTDLHIYEEDLGAGGVFGFSVTPSVTNTQVALAYTAPSSSPCTVGISESYNGPLVNDVNAALFAGSNLDSRSGALTDTAHRIFVAGKRDSETAGDGNVYSRALQAFTRHYYNINCGGTTATGFFTTANIPFNMTYQDIPQVSAPGFGGTVIPTVSSTDRTKTVIDPHTGVLIKPVSLYADHGWPGSSSQSGPFFYFGGSTKVCTKDLVGSPAIGYLCGFSQGSGGPGVLYYIIPGTGEARYLGNWPTSYPLIDPIDGKFYTLINGTDLIYQQYTGTYAAGYPANTGAPNSTTTVATGVPALIHGFDSTFDVTAFGQCSVNQFEGDYAVFSCTRGQQDSYGWLAVMNVTTASIIAAFRLDANGKYHWTGIHHVDPMYDAAGMILTTHALVGSSNGSQLGLGPYLTTYAGGSTLPIGSTSLPTSGEPVCTPCGADALAPSTLLVGDHLVFLDTQENVTITNKPSPTSLVISPTTTAHTAGVSLRAEGNYTEFVWKFLVDPHGTDITGTGGIVSETLITGHDDIVTNLLLMEGYTTRIGDVLAQAGQPWSYVFNVSATFAGATGQCYGDGCAAHPSGVGAQPWFVDALQWDGAFQAGGSIGSALAGQVYKFSGASTINPKQMAQAAAIDNPFTAGGGPHILVDVSGPGVTLGTTSADSYKYCVANAAGECYSGSSIGDIYINLPGTPAANCPGGACINNFYAYGNGDIQISNDGTKMRVVTGGLTSLKQLGGTPSARALSDGSWLLFTTGYYQGVPPSQVLMAKLPPFSAADSVDRTTFIRAPVNITSPGGSVVSATVEFWYAEQGAGNYCTSRRETCVAVASTVTDATPFFYKTTDAYTKAPCTSSCTITLPVLPVHTAYYTVRLYNAAGAFVQNGESGVVVETQKVALP